MKKVFYLFLLFATCGCSNEMNIKYTNTSEGGCEYSEVWKPRQRLLDYFGYSDAELFVNYAGVKCDTIIKKELKDNIHKTPYNGLPVVNELPPLEIDIEQE